MGDPKPDPHVLIINSLDHDEDDWYEVEHPSRCSLWVEYKEGKEVSRHVECEVTHDIEAVGANDMTANLEPGRYHLWVNLVRIDGPDWTEYDVEYEVIPVG